jgi:hypothetical protein
MAATQALAGGDFTDFGHGLFAAGNRGVVFA